MAQLHKPLMVTTAALVIVASGFALGRATAPSTATSTVPPPSTIPSSTSSTLTQPPTAIYPFATTSLRFATATDAARAFATDFLHFTNPIVSDYRAGDQQSGEVPVSNRDGGPVTTVLVRKFGQPSSWWVLGASTPNIVVDTPAPGATVTSPIELSGSSTAFEAVVNVSLYREGSLLPVKSGIVMGGSMGMMGTFSSPFAFTGLHDGRGTLVFCTLSAKDGSVVEASTVRVQFAP
jgi:hypothetical protein